MEILQAISSRRSIRKYSDRPVSKNDIEAIIRAGMLAPSAKNRQPWEFLVLAGDAKAAMLDVIKEGIQDEIDGHGILKQSKQHIAGAQNTLRIMRQAPVTVLVLNTQGFSLCAELTAEDRVYDIANMQSIGAAMQNMALAALEIGLGSLWICGIFFAYKRLQKWLGAKGEIAAAMSFGYPVESPSARPRKALAETTEWRGWKEAPPNNPDE